MVNAVSSASNGFNVLHKNLTPPAEKGSSGENHRKDFSTF